MNDRYRKGWALDYDSQNIVHKSLAPAGILSGGIEVHQGRACKGVPVEVFKKVVRKSMKNYNFVKIFKKISRFFKFL